MNFKKLIEYKRNYVSTRVKKALELAECINIKHNIDVDNEKLLMELRKVLKELKSFR